MLIVVYAVILLLIAYIFFLKTVPDLLFFVGEDNNM